MRTSCARRARGGQAIVDTIDLLYGGNGLGTGQVHVPGAVVNETNVPISWSAAEQTMKRFWTSSARAQLVNFQNLAGLPRSCNP